MLHFDSSLDVDAYSIICTDDGHTLAYMVHRICVAAVLGRVGYSATRSPIDNGHVETVDYGLQLRSALNDSLDDNFGKH